MKTFFPLSIAVLFFAYGCSQIQTPQIQQTQTHCETPLAYIYLDSITPLNNDLQINSDEVKNLLEKNLKDNCFILTQDTNNQKVYNLKITYDTSLKSSSEEKIATSKEQNTIDTKVSLVFKNASGSKTFNGKNTISINGKKILNLGQDASITTQDKEKTISSAFNAAYDSAVKNFKN